MDFVIRRAIVNEDIVKMQVGSEYVTTSFELLKSENSLAVRYGTAQT